MNTPCRTCPHVRITHALVCLHPVTVERVKNAHGLRIDKPKKYLDKNGLPDWCPLRKESKK